MSRCLRAFFGQWRLPHRAGRKLGGQAANCALNTRNDTMTTSTRRIFLMQIAATGSLASATAQALTTLPSGPATAVVETDASAVALGYVSDNNRVDKKQHSKFGHHQKCSNCALYQGSAGSASAPCPVFAGQLVAGAGWCSSWAKKA